MKEPCFDEWHQGPPIMVSVENFENGYTRKPQCPKCERTWVRASPCSACVIN